MFDYFWIKLIKQSFETKDKKLLIVE